MRVLMISDVYFPRVNGVSTSIQTFRDSLRRQGHQVDLIAPDYPGAGDEHGIYRIPSRYLFVDPEDRMMRIGRIIEMIPRLKKQAYDLIHVHTPFIAHYAGLRLARALGIPVVESYHTYFEEYLFHYVPFLPKTLMRSLARRFSRRQCNQVQRIIVPSTAMQKALTDYGIDTEMEIVPTGLSLNDFQPGSRTRFGQAHGIDTTRPSLVHIGRVAFEKNIDFLLEVVAAVRESVSDVQFIIAGEGPALPHLKRLTNQLNLNHHVHFIGYLQRGQPLWDCYSAADAFIFASHTETQGLVLLEAMALGTPVVSTEAMGTLDILAPRKGALVARPEVEHFAEKIDVLLTQPGMRLQLGDEGRSYVRQWTTERMTDRLLSLYHSLVTSTDTQPEKLSSPVCE